MAAYNSALSAISGKTRRYTNVVCYSLKIPPNPPPSTPARCGGALGANAGGCIVRSHCPYAPRLLGPRTPTPTPTLRCGPFPVGDMDRPLSSWGCGLALFFLEVCGPRGGSPFQNLATVAQCPTPNLVCAQTETTTHARAAKRWE